MVVTNDVPSLKTYLFYFEFLNVIGKHILYEIVPHELLNLWNEVICTSSLLGKRWVTMTIIITSVDIGVCTCVYYITSNIYGLSGGM